MSGAPVTAQRDRVLALAGVFQAATLVQQVARRGLVDTTPFQGSIESLLVVDAPDTESVFGGAARLGPGLKSLVEQLGQQSKARDLEITTYALRLLQLERKLMRRRDLVDRLRAGIEAARQQAEIFSSTHENVIARLAGLYQETVSTLTPRIMVKGEPSYLANPANASRIRALLLAGMRATILWRQRGGTRVGLVFGRAWLVATAEDVRHALRERP